MPKCVKTISVDAMHLFEVYLDVAALFIFCELCGVILGPILSLKMRLMTKLEEWTFPQR